MSFYISIFRPDYIESITDFNDTDNKYVEIVLYYFYDTFEKVNKLINGGNIIQLGYDYTINNSKEKFSSLFGDDIYIKLKNLKCLCDFTNLVTKFTKDELSYVENKSKKHIDIKMLCDRSNIDNVKKIYLFKNHLWYIVDRYDYSLYRLNTKIFKLFLN